jgi:hypothetical protein
VISKDYEFDALRSQDKIFDVTGWECISGDCYFEHYIY